jgi:anti-sigma factor RsiW
MTKKRTETYLIGGKHGATCGEFLALLNEYVDGVVAPADCNELERHLAHCNPCRVVVDNIRKTITLYRGAKPCKLPAGFHSRLHSALRKCWKESGPAATA